MSEGNGQLPREPKTEVFDDGRVVVTAGSMGRGNWAIGDYSFVGGVGPIMRMVTIPASAVGRKIRQTVPFPASPADAITGHLENICLSAVAYATLPAKLFLPLAGAKAIMHLKLHPQSAEGYLTEPAAATRLSAADSGTAPKTHDLPSAMATDWWPSAIPMSLHDRDH